LLRELFGGAADPAQEGAPARVGVHLVEEVLEDDLGLSGVAVLDRFVEPFERLVGLAKG